MDNSYRSVIESLIFASEEPINAAVIVESIQGIDGDDLSLSAEDVAVLVDELNQLYDSQSASFRIIRIAEGFLFASRPEFAKYIGFLSSEKSRRRLSQAALETLAIIAYRQPIPKPEIEAIRGVHVDSILGTLLEKQLITITGRAETIGRPLLYGTTKEFLKYFGLHSLADLPKPREIEEIMQDQDFLDQKRKIMMNAIEESIENETSERSSDDSRSGPAPFDSHESSHDSSTT